MPSSVTITSPTSNATVPANFNVSTSYSSAESTTTFVLLRCEHPNGSTQVAATVGPNGSGTSTSPIPHTLGYTGVTITARLQLTMNWGDSFLASSAVTNITISPPSPPT